MSIDARLLSGVTVLATVVEQGSFTRAAALLGLSPSGVSRAISRLETRMAVRLIARSTRALRLTAEGSRLYELAAPHLAAIEEAATAASRDAAEVAGLLRASVAVAFSRQILTAKLPEFAQRFPAIELHISQHSDAGDLNADGLDVAVRFGDQPSSSMISRRLLETRVLTVASPRYLAAHGRPSHPSDLAGHNCLQFLDPQNGRPFEWEFQRAGETISVSTAGNLTLSDAGTLVGACVAGSGIAQVLALSVGDELRSGLLVDLFPDWPGETFPLYIIRPSRRFTPLKVEKFVDFCLEIAQGTAQPTQLVAR